MLGPSRVLLQLGSALLVLGQLYGPVQPQQQFQHPPPGFAQPQLQPGQGQPRLVPQNGDRRAFPQGQFFQQPVQQGQPGPAGLPHPAQAAAGLQRGQEGQPALLPRNG